MVKNSKHFLSTGEYIIDKTTGEVLPKKVHLITHINRHIQNKHQKEDSLFNKQQLIEEASQPERLTRENAVRTAHKNGTPLSSTKIMSYRRREELERFLAYKFFSKSSLCH